MTSGSIKASDLLESIPPTFTVPDSSWPGLSQPSTF